jgi:N-6 DNA Methylase
MSSSLKLKTIPNEPLPGPAKEAALAGIQRCGFSSETILENYGFSSTTRKQAVNLNIHAVAFAHRNLNLSNAGITLFNAVNGQNNEELVSLLAQSTAPFHIIHRDNQFTFLASSVQNNKPETIHIESHISYDQIGRVLSDHANDLKPQRILDVKQGRDTFSHPLFRAVGSLQLALWATEVNSGSLVKVFGNAVYQLRRGIEEQYDSISSNRKMKDTVTDLSIQLLGATILADTGVLGPDIRFEGAATPLDKLLSKASKEFSDYFLPNLFERYQEPAEAAYQLLRQIHYSGFLPEMLRELYLEAYSKEDRRRSGSFDTPLYLTRHIWKHIPVEYLPPKQRVAVDITCGWGSFLIAGYERLSQLGDMKDRSLLNYLRGNDIYHFTSRLAGLGLLLSTSEDHWHIDDEDALTWSWLERNQPDIIVGNPPFRDPRTLYKDEQRSSVEDETEKSEAANRFLKRAIERLAPGGYLAMIMPRSFTVGSENSTKQLRQQLLEQCDVQELLELPSGVFRDANPRALVIIAQKRQRSQSQSHFPVRVRTVQNGTLKNFQDFGIVTASRLVADQSVWKTITYQYENSKSTSVMEYSLILSENMWQQIQSRCTPLADYAHVFRGAIVGTQRKATLSSPSREILWLPNAGAVPESFHIVYENPPQTKLYPDDFERERPEDRQAFEGTKVLVVRSTDTSWGRRSKVAVERRGYYVSGSYHVVVPRSDRMLESHAMQEAITNEVLAAIIYWYVGNAWIIEHTTSLGIPKYAIETIPFPNALTTDDCDVLNMAVKRLQENDGSDAESFEQIDRILKRAYGLDEATFEHLREITKWDSKTRIIYDRQPDPIKADCFVSGCVESIDAQQNAIKLRIKGIKGAQRVQITPSMPGWLLRPGTEFYTKIPRHYVDQEYISFNNIDWDTFHPQMYTYLSEVDLMEDFANLL